MMNSFDAQRQDSLMKSMMRWQSQAHHHHHQQQQFSSTFLSKIIPGPPNPSGPFPSRNPRFNPHPGGSTTFVGLLDDGNFMPAFVPPAVTVVLEGRSICHRICLHKHESYQSLARAVREMFVEEESDFHGLDAGMANEKDMDLDLSNAIPGYLIAYEDMENDLLLAGDLNWKDFVRVAKRIRIMPARSNSRTKARGGMQAMYPN